MSSLAEKMSMVVEEYNHSKNSPAYRKLNTKYKALKTANAELIQLLTNIFAELHSKRAEAEDAPRKKSNPKPKLRKASQIPVVYESESDSEQTTCTVEYNKNKLKITKSEDNTNPEVVEVDIAIFPEQERDLPHICESTENVGFSGETLQNIHGENKYEEVVEQESDKTGVEESTEEEVEVLEESTVEESTEEESTEEVEVVEESTVEESTEEVEVAEESTEEEVEVVEESTEEEVEVAEESTEEEVEVAEESTEEEEAGVYEIEVNGVRYYTTNEQDGIVYALIDDDDVGDEVGNFVKGKLVLNK